MDFISDLARRAGHEAQLRSYREGMRQAVSQPPQRVDPSQSLLQAYLAICRDVDTVWRERLLMQDCANAERLAAWRSRRPYFVGYMEGEHMKKEGGR